MDNLKIQGMFKIIVTVIVQSVFYLKIYQNNFFIFYKLFLISAHQNNLKILKKLFYTKFFLKKRNLHRVPKHA